MNLKIAPQHQLRSDLKIPFLPTPKAWTGLALNGQIICGFDLDPQSPVVEQVLATKQAVTQAYFEALPQLSFLQKLILISSDLFTDFFDVDLALEKISGGRSFAELHGLGSLIQQLPTDFLFWVHEKNLHFFDLAVLLSLSTDPNSAETKKWDQQVAKFGKILSSWSEVQYSKSQGVQILELLVELFLIHEKNENQVTVLKLQLQTSADQTLKNLKQLRYPETSLKDAESKSVPLPWPGIVQAQGQRQGDRWGYRLNFFVSNPYELTKTVDQLQKAAEQWKNQN